DPEILFGSEDEGAGFAQQLAQAFARDFADELDVARANGVSGREIPAVAGNDQAMVRKTEESLDDEIEAFVWNPVRRGDVNCSRRMCAWREELDIDRRMDDHCMAMVAAVDAFANVSGNRDEPVDGRSRADLSSLKAIETAIRN